MAEVTGAEHKKGGLHRRCLNARKPRIAVDACGDDRPRPAKAHLGGEKGGFPQTTWGLGHGELDARGSAFWTRARAARRRDVQ